MHASTLMCKYDKSNGPESGAKVLRNKHYFLKNPPQKKAGKKIPHAYTNKIGKKLIRVSFVNVFFSLNCFRSGTLDKFIYHSRLTSL